eukprot:6190181-Pleurochrysis_carterae.AAC.3
MYRCTHWATRLKVAVDQVWLKHLLNHLKRCRSRLQEVNQGSADCGGVRPMRERDHLGMHRLTRREQRRAWARFCVRIERGESEWRERTNEGQQESVGGKGQGTEAKGGRDGGDPGFEEESSKADLRRSRRVSYGRAWQSRRSSIGIACVLLCPLCAGHPPQGF